jgi:methylmalonyl-CoA/ethylmalonyl-CoA epimerase
VIGANAPDAGNVFELHLFMAKEKTDRIRRGINESNTHSLEFAQTCWVVPDIESTIAFLSASLGVVFPKPQHVRAQDLNMTYYGEVVPAEWLTTQAYNGIFIEIVQPLSGKSMFQDYLDKLPEGGVQHNAFRFSVERFEEVTSDYRKKGFAAISEVDHPIARMAFFDTYKTLGFVTELMGITPQGQRALKEMQRAG